MKLRFQTYIFVLLMGLLGFAGVASAKATICTITINSPDEKNIFMSKLDRSQFQFVELTEMGSHGKGSSDWFERACASGVQCDSLVISGHFGGQFFGASNLTLELNELEGASCQKKCTGILEKPKEVYLFGCNTLAGKTKDARTPQQYLRVLLEDGINPVEAERIVSSRYGPFGASFRDRMERVFENVPVIYGFHSIAPSGRNVRSALNNYMARIGNYRSHLDRINDTAPNVQNWFESMKAFNRDIGAGLKSYNPAYAVKTNMCRLEDKNTLLSDRLAHAVDLLTRAPMLYLPAASKFANEALRDFKTHNQLDSDETNLVKAQLVGLSGRMDLKEFFDKAMNSRGVPTSVKIDLIEAEHNFSWIDDREYRDRLGQVLTQLVSHPTTENADLFCSVAWPDKPYAKFVNPKAFEKYDFSTLTQYKMARCADVSDLELTKKAVAHFSTITKKLSIDDKSMAFAYLLDLPVSGFESEMLEILKPYLNWRGTHAAVTQLFAKMASLRFLHGDELTARLNEILSLPNVRDTMHLLTEYMSGNRIRDDRAIVSVMARFLLDPQGQAWSFYDGFYGASVPAQDWLADHFDHLPTDFVSNMNLEFHRTGPVQSERFKQVVIRLVELYAPQLKKPEVLGPELPRAKAMFKLLRVIPFSVADLHRLMKVYQVLPENDERQTLRDILYVQGKGRVHLGASILNGWKTYVKYTFAKDEGFTMDSGAYTTSPPPL